MSLWHCTSHGITGPMACCGEASRVEGITPIATFQCAECRGTFPKVWTDEEIDAEYSRTHPDEWAAGIPCGLLCESCYQAVDAKDAE